MMKLRLISMKSKMKSLLATKDKQQISFWVIVGAYFITFVCFSVHLPAKVEQISEEAAMMVEENNAENADF